MTQGPMMLKDAVALLVRIAGLDDPASLRLGDRLNLIDDLRRYLDISPVGKTSRELDRAQDEPVRLKPVTQGVRELVDAAADGKKVELSFGPGKVVFDGAKLGARDALLWDSNLRDEIIQLAATDLAELKPRQLGRCAVCKRVFPAARKGQRYCSHACAVKVAVRRYQTRHRAERAERERERRGRKNPKFAVATPGVPHGEATR